MLRDVVLARASVYQGSGCGDGYGGNVISDRYFELPFFHSSPPNANTSYVPQCVHGGSQINVVMYVEWASYPVAIMYDVIPSLGVCEMVGVANKSMSSLLQCARPDTENVVTMLSFPNTIQANVSLGGQYVVMEIYRDAQCEGNSSEVVLTLLDTCLDTGAEGSLPRFIQAHFDGR